MNEAQIENGHIEMWKHYDNLRWQKKTAFLIANSIFVAILALKAENLSKEVIGALSFLGVESPSLGFFF